MCKPPSHTCANNTSICLPPEKLCDGSDDCGDGSDEGELCGERGAGRGDAGVTWERDEEVTSSSCPRRSVFPQQRRLQPQLYGGPWRGYRVLLSPGHGAGR